MQSSKVVNTKLIATLRQNFYGLKHITTATCKGALRELQNQHALLKLIAV